MTFKTHLREVVSKAVRSLGVVHQAGKLFDVLQSCFNLVKSCFNAYAYVFSSLEYCAPVWISAESHLGFMDTDKMKISTVLIGYVRVSVVV